jgi:hypothetical protein
MLPKYFIKFICMSRSKNEWGYTSILTIRLHGVAGKGKVVPVLNEAPLPKDVLGSGDIAPHILDLGTRWR